MKMLTKNQLQAVQATMSRLCSNREERLEMLSDICGRNIDSTKNLEWQEANLILSRLGGSQLEAVSAEKKRLRATIYHLSMQIDFLNAPFADNEPTHTEREMNKAKVNLWLQGHGVVKKCIADMNCDELGRTIGQMKGIVHKQKQSHA